ncbi:dihydrodipicolinate synthase family protein [Microbacterium sp.]|uniref:dihydrodipicolinate synthase family protein n=1 Tax=Microbacterium sp. TaxID=51671 RepID=UPI003F6F8C95
MSIEQVIVALPTLFTTEDALDVDNMQRLFDKTALHADAAFVTGTNGEFLALSRGERADVARLALASFGVERTILHVGAVTTSQVEGLIQDGIALGATRFAVTPPLTFATDQSSIRAHFAQVRKLTAGLALYAYLYPEICRNTVEPEEAAFLEDLGFNGLKISGTAARKLDDYARRLSIPVWTGDDRDLASALSRGATGVVSGCANIDARAWSEVKTALLGYHDARAVADAQDRVNEIVDAVGPSIAHLKLGLSVLGWGTGSLRLNLPAVPAIDAARIGRLREEVSLSDRP